MEVGKLFKSLYQDYYLDDEVLLKRKIAARQSLEHISSLLPKCTYESLIDIGAGDGSLLEELDRANIARELFAIEISDSGYETIKRKDFSKVLSISKFDGYHIHGHYNLGLAVHVLEHVEHEREFLKEIGRTCDYFYVEVPLELTLRVNKNIKTSSKYGHINFYNIFTFKNLLDSCNIELISIRTFSASLEYERHLSGFFGGTMKYYLKNCALKIAPNLAQLIFIYMAGAYCQIKDLPSAITIKK